MKKRTKVSKSYMETLFVKHKICFKIFHFVIYLKCHSFEGSSDQNESFFLLGVAYKKGLSHNPFTWLPL